MTHHPDDCQGNCRWRQLYEGNLLSQADLNDKLRAAVGRHGRLRNNLVSTMRKAFSGLFLEAERREQRRMSDQPDEVLLRYLTMWLTQRPGTGLAAGPGVSDLRGALTAAGFVLPPDADLAGWARAVTEQQQDRQRDAAPADAPAPATDELVGIFDPHTPPRRAEPEEPVGPGPVDPEHPAADDDLALLLFADTPAGPDTNPDTFPTPAARQQRAGVEQPGIPAVDDRPAAQPATARGTDTATSTPEPTDAPADAPTPEPAPEPLAAPAPKPSTAPSSAPAGPPLRPQLFPKENTGKTRRRRPKASTTASAQSPGPSIDVPQTDRAPGDGPVPADLHDQAVALVKRPNPVFSSDLVTAGLGSEADVAAWEQSCRDDTDSPVRFIPPKSRHRQRGGLIIPYSYAKQAPAEFGRTTWAQMLDRYRGARLYELAVVLHRVQDDVMSADLHDGHVVLRLAQARGMVALVVTTEADFDRGDDARDALVTAVESLLPTPLTLLGVLCTNHNALPKAIRALEEEARERDWAPAFPIMAQRSWEYAADRGSSATLVVDG